MLAEMKCEQTTNNWAFLFLFLFLFLLLLLLLFSLLCYTVGTELMKTFAEHITKIPRFELVPNLEMASQKFLNSFTGSLWLRNFN